jgi:sugar O-acyltransferase (sialic acid O-acetyltransferase NeuD family)
MADLVIFGTGDVARIAHYYFTEDTPHRVVAFTVDRDYRDATSLLGLPVIDFEEVERHHAPSAFKMFVAVSYARMNQVRAAKYAEAKAKGYELLTYVSSRCSFLTKEPIGDNCMVQEDNTVQPFVKIGNNVTLWSGNHIGHDSTIEDHCFIASHVVVSGRVQVGSYSFIGVNATLRNGITIAPRSLIGAGAVILKNTEEGGVYVPAEGRVLARKSDQIKL